MDMLTLTPFDLASWAILLALNGSMTAASLVVSSARMYIQFWRGYQVSLGAPARKELSLI